MRELFRIRDELFMKSPRFREGRIGANPQADFDFAKDRRDVTLMPLVPQDLN
ncbi:hypothetical protein ALC57_03282 [Trachymyrmex cornetzi]|uniref:Uncharacterized protein n=1 Tax=Trachymyrmex cornetzi TaxID=471704 RepID=A0A195EFK0_9HYME|nr:hypothetical protein ALC57_03282 [Trachymyrmex cornetzi]